MTDFTFTDEQNDLRAAVRRLLDRGGDGPLWTKMVDELGLTALAVPEKHGGFGASFVEVAVALEETGAALTPVPLLSATTASAAVDPSTPAGAALLPRLAAGTVATLAFGPSLRARRDADLYRVDGTATHVLDGGEADIAIAACSDGLFAVPLLHATRTVHPTLDRTRSQATLVFDAAPAQRVGPSAVRALSYLRAGLAVESVGVARAALAVAVEHLKTRRQFGAPLATFQALRHRVADLTVRVEAATSSAWYAVRAAGSDGFPVAASVAKLVATEAAFEVTGESIQLLGGIGFTWEHPAHRYFKRATANRLLAGTPEDLRRTLATAALR